MLSFVRADLMVICFGRGNAGADPSTETTYQAFTTLNFCIPTSKVCSKATQPIYGHIFPYITGSYFQSSAQPPTPSGGSTACPNSSEFFGLSDRLFALRTILPSVVDLFKGRLPFKPIDWALRLVAVYNHNYIDVEERNVVNPNPQTGRLGSMNFRRCRRRSPKFICGKSIDSQSTILSPCAPAFNCS